MKKQGILLIISGPSGSGKGTIVGQLCKKNDFSLSISATTRKPRDYEENGVHYFFHTREEFEEMKERGELLEWAEFCGNCYGTPRRYVVDQLMAGKNVILEIEVQGALLVKEKCPNALLVFVAPPSWEELRDRLVGRGTEDAATIENRLNIARGELKQAVHYDYILVNDTVEAAAQRLEHIIEAGHCRNIEMKDFIEEVEHHA